MKSFLLFSLVSFFSSALAFIFLPLISATLTLDSFADYSFLYSVSVVLSSAFLFGCPASYSLAVAEKNEDYAAKSLKLFLLSNFFLGFLLLFFLSLFVLFGNRGGGLLFVVLFVMGRSAFLMTSHYFRVHKNTAYFASYQIITLLLSFTLPLLLNLFIVNLSGVFYFGVMGCVMFLAGFMGVFLFKQNGYLNNLFINPFKLSFFRFGCFAALHSLAAALISTVDRFILVNYVEKDAFAIYALGATLASALSFVYSIINQNMTPDLFASLKSSNDDSKVLFKYVKSYSFGVFLLFITYQMSIGFIVDLFFDERFNAAIFFARLLAVGTLIQGFYFFPSSLLMYLNLSDVLFRITVSLGLFSIISCFFSYQIFGVTGVVLNSILVWLLYAVITYIVALREFRRKSSLIY